MYFRKSEGATVPDGMADASTVAMAGQPNEPLPGAGVPDVPAVPTGVPLPVQLPQTVINKPVVTPVYEQPPLPTQPFIVMPPEVSVPAFVQPESTQPEKREPEKKESVQNEPEKKAVVPKTFEAGPEVTQLPPRNAIFMIYDDPTLETMIYGSISKQLGKTADELRKQSPFPVMKPAVPPGTHYVAKTEQYPPNRVVYEAGYVVHNRLHFEEKNSERYGWDLGLMTPFVSTASFYKNVLLWPNHVATSLVIGRQDTNAGKCLPGSPTPYILYPQGLTITGTVTEGVVITGLSFIIP